MSTSVPNAFPALPVLGHAVPASAALAAGPSRRPKPTAPLPMTRAERWLARGWDAVDVVFVTGDAYVDHPSFAMALLGRLLEAEGFRVAILSQPDWQSCDAWRTFGRPRLCFAISAGNMDSMINHYTANRKVRNDDAYCPGGQIGRRPDRATLAYCQRAARGLSRACRSLPAASRPACAAWPITIIGATRSAARSCSTAKADLLVYGMGERAHRRDRPPPGGRRKRCATFATCGAWPIALGAKRIAADSTAPLDRRCPATRRCRTDKWAFAAMTKIIAQRDEPLQRQAAGAISRPRGDRRAIRRRCRSRRPRWTASTGCRFTRKPHPSYGKQQIPAYEVVKDSVQIMRGCFGGCTFCSITAHEGRIIQSRSQESILGEIRQMTADPISRAWSATSAGPRPTCTRCTARGPRSRPSAGG